MRAAGSISQPRALTSDVGTDGFPLAEAGAQTQIAPIHVVRQLKNMIAGENREGESMGCNVLDELINIGIDPDENGKFLLEGYVVILSCLNPSGMAILNFP